MSLVQRLRASIRLVGIVVLTGLSGLALFIALPLSKPFPRARVRWNGWIFRRWGRLFLRILGVRVTTHGRPPAAPFFLVANHLSYVDIPLIASHTDAAFISKAELETWPAMGLISRWAGTVFIDRSLKRDIPRVLSEVKNRLELGQGVVLFPEGTSSAGAKVCAFRPSVLEVPARGQLPVSWATLAYRTPAGENPAHLAVCWWGDMTFFDHFYALLGIRSFEAIVTFGDQPITAPDRKQLSARLHAAISESFLPSAPSEQV